jgi:uncharacterized protein YgiM (DUF1202 family)
VTPAEVVATAQRYLGSPYAYIGDSPSTGFSCIGFVHFVFKQLGVDVPYDIPMAWNSAPHVAFSDLMPGDVLFYSNTVFAGLSHVAIYIGNGQMIGADNYTVGVTTDNVTDSYWMNHYTGATRPLAATNAAQAPQTQAPATATPLPQVAAIAPAGTLLKPLSSVVGVYSGPGYQYTSLGVLAVNTTLTVEQGQDGWYDVQFQQAHVGVTFGWVNAADVAPLADGSSTQATVAPTQTPTPEPTATPQFSRAAAVSGAATSPALVVLAGPLNVRSGPGKQYASVGAVRKGDHLLLLSELPGWAKITTSKGLTGWVSRQYVTALNDTPQVSKASVTTQGPSTARALPRGSVRVTASVLNVRNAPNATAHVISVLFAGEVVPVLARTGGWDEVRLSSGTIGWVSAKYLATK